MVAIDFSLFPSDERIRVYRQHHPFFCSFLIAHLVQLNLLWPQYEGSRSVRRGVSLLGHFAQPAGNSDTHLLVSLEPPLFLLLRETSTSDDMGR